MKHLIKHLFSEYGDFMEYIEMYEDCTDPNHKAHFRKLAEEEMQHYKRIYDMIFPKLVPGPVKWTDIEQGIYEYATHLWHDMEKKLNDLK